MKDEELIQKLKEAIRIDYTEYYQISSKTDNQEDKDNYSLMKYLYDAIESLNTLEEIKGVFSSLKSQNAFYKDTISRYEHMYMLNKRYETKDERVLYLMQLNDQILSLKEKNKTESLNSKIFELCLNREVLLQNLFGYTGSTLAHELESLEDTYVLSSNEEKESEYTLDSNKYVSELKSLLSKLNDLYFYEETLSDFNPDTDKEDITTTKNKKYNRLRNMIISLYGSIDIEINENMSFAELLSYLEIFNINGNYDDYSEKYKTVKIGAASISKEIYDEMISSIKKAIAELLSKSKSLIESKSNQITISDYTINRSDVYSQILAKELEIIKSIEKATMKLSKAKGDKDVH